MPLIEVTYRPDTLSRIARDRLAPELMAVFARCAGGEDIDQFPSVSQSVRFVELADSATYRGGRRCGDHGYLLSVTVRAGVLSDEMKASMAEQATAAILAADAGSAARDKVWCNIYEVAPGNWGVLRRADHLRGAAQSGAGSFVYNVALGAR